MITDKPKVAQLLENIRALDPQAQLDLLEQIAVLLRTALPTQPSRSILELEGLGAQIWKGINAQTYVNQERTVWDG